MIKFLKIFFICGCLFMALLLFPIQEARTSAWLTWTLLGFYSLSILILEGETTKLKNAVLNHYNKSIKHENCFQNDVDLWRDAGIIGEAEFKQRYWPPVGEMALKCGLYIAEHHPECQMGPKINSEAPSVAQDAIK